jgi:hypothetical protein
LKSGIRSYGRGFDFELIAHAINDFDLDKQLIRDLTATIESCLQCDGLTWEAEQETGIAVARAKLAIA